MSPVIMLVSLFPIVHVIGFLALLFWGIHVGSIALIFLAFADLYLLPPLALRFQELFLPLREGEAEFSFKKYHPWFGAYSFQVLFIAVPPLESVLRFVPGAYSAWLRLWGARIGKGVFWTPLVEIIDRSLLDVENYVVVGHRATFTCHFINPKRGEAGLKIYIKRTRLGEHSFVGAGVRVGPGVTILPRSLIKYNMECWTDKTYDSNGEVK